MTMTRRLALAGALVLGTSGIAFADNEEAAVNQAIENLRKAMVDADKDKLAELVSDQLSYGHSSGRLENKAEFIATLVSGDAGFTAIELADQTVNIVDKVALVRHGFNGTSRKDGGHTKLSILTVWLDQQGEWKLLARQAAKL